MNNTLRACLCMVGAVVSFCSMAVSGRLLAEEFDTFEIMAYRSVIGLSVVVAVAYWAGSLREISTKDFPLHTLRNTVHFIAQNLWFAALTMIPLAQVFALEFTAPIWVMVFAALFLGEALTKLRVSCAIAGFFGVLLVARPEAGELNIGLVFAATAAVGFAVAIITTQQLTRHHSITCILFWLTTMQAVLGILSAAVDGDMAWPSLQGWPLLIAVGAAGLAAHFFLTKALSLAPATIVVPIDFARLPLIAILGAILFAEPLDIWVFVGGLIIFAANYINTIAAIRQPNTHSR